MLLQFFMSQLVRNSFPLGSTTIAPLRCRSAPNFMAKMFVSPSGKSR